MAKVLTLVERDAREGTVRRSACALLTLARRLGEPVAVVGGAPPSGEVIKELSRHGATEIWCLADTDQAPRATDTDLLAALAQRLNPAAILIASTSGGQETAARLAIRLDSGIITDAVDLHPGPGGEAVAVQRCLAGSYLVESTIIRGVPVITVRPEAALPEPHPAEAALHAIAVEPSPHRAPRVVAIPEPRAACPTLDHADIVVAGGRGVGSRAAFAVLADVAEALGAAVAGSHTAAELGWVPSEARVGLNGKTVHPRLYLACGVSGSVRHRAGMQGAKTVIAIGDDPAAPIFKLAELGVVGDVQTILPALLAEIRARRRPHDPDPDPDPR
ncbi:electron transfer flavoprotein subunit alpha/FixB family protein [Catenulispora pinisilvae]|uniref:electron transfer flavoprotein subunit alpha/FixB family protein n=1 Tax=Catenulispora pinisilvae TaxID=2705253 RepID=UPI001891CBAE|nr:electron transfer flavoprotein subunit alpha/FixB family protein [Catenulispora pinisilvae]